MKKKYLITIVGPTAVGKTALAISLAQEFQTAILSADSRQFYKELTIGTAKPTSSELASAKHYFINNLSITEDFNASDFEKEALVLLDQLFSETNAVILCGGSGMYIDALLKGFDQEVPTANEEIRKQLYKDYKENGIEFLQEQLKNLDPEFYSTVDLANSKRVMRAIEVCLLTGKKYSEIRRGKQKERSFIPIKIGLNLERELLYKRINSRVDQMMQMDLLEEVRAAQPWQDKNALKTVGYKELFDFLNGVKSLEEAVEKIKVNSRRYAKRQLTWFKRDLEIEWFQPNEKGKIIEYIRRRIKENEQG